MTNNPARATQPLLALDPADAAEFARVRSEILPARRRELTQREFEREEYDGFRALGENIPFLCSSEWIPRQPVLLPLPDDPDSGRPPVIIEYDASLQAQLKREWTDDVLHAAPRILPRFAGTGSRVPSYAEAITLTREISGGALFNGLCYRLLALDVGPRAQLKLSFGVCRYFDYLNTTEILAHEAALGTSREIRAAAGHWLHDLHRRHAGSGICALTLIRKANGELELLLMDRSRSQVHTGLGLIHVRPAGEFQPLSENPAQFGEECNLWYALLRESLEEIGGINMPRHFAGLREFLAFDGIAAMIEAVRSGAWRTYYLGFGFDPLNYKPEFLLCSIVEEQAFHRMFPGFQRDSSEGRGFDGNFSLPDVEKLLAHPRLHPAAGACLSRAQEQCEFLRNT